MKNIRLIHENYHKDIKKTLKIIGDNNFTYRLIIEVINRHLKKRLGVKVLDIGCGAGSISFYLANKDFKVTGIDISQKAIVECRNSAKNLKLKNAKFERIDFPDGSKLKEKFNFVIFTEVIEHLLDDQLAIKAIYRLLEKEGKLILSTPSINAPLNRFGLTKNFDKEVGHLRRYELNYLKHLLKINGFVIVETKKTEGIVRNFLFVNKFAGKLVRFINRFASNPVTSLDNFSLKLFGESNYIIVAKKLD